MTSATDKYGSSAMAAIQKGLVDREALHAVVLGRSTKPARFAEGGPVGYAVNQPIQMT
jgi:hypothetical protein